MDILTPKHRSALMARIRDKNTAPELTVRSCIHKLGYRFKLHDRRLPGSPDIVLARLRTVILVHGCFWHRHRRCKLAYTPKSRISFWLTKFEGNISRDKRVRRSLRELGWTVLVIWECETENAARLAGKLKKSLDSLELHSREKMPQRTVTGHK